MTTFFSKKQLLKVKKDTSYRSNLLAFYIVILIISSSFYFIRLNDTSIYIFDIFFALGLFAFNKSFFLIPRLLSLSIIFFITVSSLSIFFNLIDSTGDINQFIIIILRFLQIILVSNLFINYLNHNYAPNHYRWFVKSAIISILVVIFGGIYAYFNFPESAIVFDRYAGFLSNPNYMSLYIVSSASILIYLIHLSNFRFCYRLLILLFMLSIILYSILLTGSNSGILLLLVTALILFFSSKKKFLIGIALIFLYFIFIDFFLNVINEIASTLALYKFSGFKRSGELILSLFFSQEDINSLGSVIFRKDIRIFLFDIQFSNLWTILFGLGFGQSPNLSLQNGLGHVTVHNFYFWIFIESGLVGVITFVLMYYLALRSFFWNLDAIRISIGFLLALSATPVLYLPFFWMPVLSVLLIITIKQK